MARFDIGARSYKHGHAARGGQTPEWTSWRAMTERCTNPRHVGFKYYGARGVKVCAQWASFETFLADMGPKPTPRHAIDRINPDGDYEPSNCRWATPAEQRRNQRPYDQTARCLKGWETRRARGWEPRRNKLGRFKA